MIPFLLICHRIPGKKGINLSSKGEKRAAFFSSANAGVILFRLILTFTDPELERQIEIVPMNRGVSWCLFRYQEIAYTQSTPERFDAEE